jgi:hypothetical protein
MVELLPPTASFLYIVIIILLGLSTCRTLVILCFIFCTLYSVFRVRRTLASKAGKPCSCTEALTQFGVGEAVHSQH